ncbi:Folylpolyglutamate synthetase [Ceratobasidium sp. 423]|nr:Folylpolyglutamate synthetase [Ceratobasidium sp. 423]
MTLDALHDLNHKLQSNAATVAAAKASGPKAELSIQNTIRDLRRIGYQPEDLNKLNVIHVTGTKGKGSTCAFCYSLLRKAAPHLKIGLYTSPHLVSVRERIQVDGKPISEEDFARFFYEVWDRLEATKDQGNPDRPMPMYFGMLTLIAFHAFVSLGVNATILEVGIGGRFDTTNIVPKPIVTGITSLGLDHTFMLGKTLPEIAWQKAGIYKVGVPAYTIDQPPEALEVIKKEAEKASEFHIVDTPLEMSEIKLGLAGVHQRQNAALAMHLVHRFLQLQSSTLKLPESLSPIPEIYATGLNEARWAGRCQQIVDPREGLQWFLDGAHTIESLTSCAEWYFTTEIAFRDTNLKRTLIFNCSGGRAGRQFLDIMLQIASEKMKLANYDVPHPGLLFDRVIFCTNITTPEDMDRSIKKAERDEVLALTTQREFADAWIDLVPGYPKENVLTMPGQRDNSDSSSDVEVIEDSEPERQERLAKLRQARKQLQKGKDLIGIANPTSQASTLTQVSPPSTSGRTTSVVSTGTLPRAGGKSTHLTARLNADGYSLKGASQPPVRLAKTSSLPVRRPAPPPWLASATTSSRVDPPTNTTSPGNSVPLKSSSQPSPVKPLDLNGFAYQRRTVGRTAGYSTSSRSVSGSKAKAKEISAAESCSDVPKPPASLAKASSSPKVFILGATKECPDTEASFTSEQIASLHSCVVCGNSWTTRKLPKSKWSHITSCARKVRCDLDTLYMKLIAAIVDASDAKGKKSTKGKEKEKEATGSQSLLVQIVRERAPPKKRGRRVEPSPSNLQPVQDTHKVILERGAALLGVAPVLNVENQPDVIPETPAGDQLAEKEEAWKEVQEEKEEAQEDEPNIPATQGFAPSKIGGRSRLLGPTLATMNIDSRSGLFYADLPRQERTSPLSPVDSHASFFPSSRRQSFGEEWNSQEGVYMWEEYNPSRPPSPTDSLANYIYEMSLRENDMMLGEAHRGRSRSPRLLSKSRSRSRRSSRPSRKRSKSPAKRSRVNRKKTKSPRPDGRSSPHGHTKSKPVSRKGKAKGRSRSKSKSRSRSKFRLSSPKPRKRWAARQGSVYAPEDGQARTKDIDAKLLELILQNQELYLRILRYEPIKFEDILNMAIENGVPEQGLHVKLRAFLDSQCINFYTAEARGRKKKRHV